MTDRRPRLHRMCHPAIQHPPPHHSSFFVRRRLGPGGGCCQLTLRRCAGGGPRGCGAGGRAGRSTPKEPVFVRGLGSPVPRRCDSLPRLRTRCQRVARGIGPIGPNHSHRPGGLLFTECIRMIPLHIAGFLPGCIAVNPSRRSCFAPHRSRNGQGQTVFFPETTAHIPIPTWTLRLVLKEKGFQSISQLEDCNSKGWPI